MPDGWVSHKLKKKPWTSFAPIFQQGSEHINWPPYPGFLLLRVSVILSISGYKSWFTKLCKSGHYLCHFISILMTTLILTSNCETITCAIYCSWYNYDLQQWQLFFFFCKPAVSNTPPKSSVSWKSIAIFHSFYFREYSFGFLIFF